MKTYVIATSMMGAILSTALALRQLYLGNSATSKMRTREVIFSEKYDKYMYNTAAVIGIASGGAVAGPIIPAMFAYSFLEAFIHPIIEYDRTIHDDI